MTRAVVLYISDILQQMEDALEFIQGTSHLTLLSKGWLTSGLAPVK